jgi:hypothetical protein
MHILANDSLDWRNLVEFQSFKSVLLPRLLALWQSRIIDGGLPSRKSFSASELIQFGGRIALIEVQQDPERFRFRLIGTYITEKLGRDSTGMYLDELYDRDKYDLAVEGYRHCVRHRTPAAAKGSMVHAGKDFVTFEAIDLPLASDGVNVDLIIKGTDFLD